MRNETSEHRFDMVDVFAERKYQGNQLAVLQDCNTLTTEEMQQIALETNFSETTFITDGNASDGYDVRIFTPSFEIPFAGHPTLGTAAVQRMLDAPTASRIVLRLPVGEVSVEFDGDLAWLTAPKTECRDTKDARDAELIAASLGIDVSGIDSGYPIQDCTSGPDFTMVPIKSLDVLESVSFDSNYLPKYAELGISNLVYLFARGSRSGKHAMTVRLFFEANGVREDPATGSAAVCLGAYLLEHDYLSSQSIDITLSQGVAVNRPSVLYLNATKQGIRVGGNTVPVASGTWLHGS